MKWMVVALVTQHIVNSITEDKGNVLLVTEQGVLTAHSDTFKKSLRLAFSFTVIILA